MSIENSFGMYTPTCDCCGAELESEFDFQSAVDAKKTAGWRSVKQEWGWDDYCSGCYQKIITEGVS